MSGKTLKPTSALNRLSPSPVSTALACGTLQDPLQKLCRNFAEIVPTSLSADPLVSGLRATGRIDLKAYCSTDRLRKYQTAESPKTCRPFVKGH